MGAVWVDVVGRVSPGECFGVDAPDSERLLDCVQMMKTKPFEGEASPCRLHWRCECGCPVMAVGCVPVKKPEMEKREVVDKLIDSIPLLLAESSVDADETAFCECFKGISKRDSVAYVGKRCDFLALQAAFLLGKRACNLDVERGVLEEGMKEFLEFAFERRAFFEENPIHVLGKRRGTVKLPPVERNAANCHIALGNVFSGHFHASGTHVEFAFAKGERLKEDSCRDAVVKRTSVAEQLLDHPRRRRAAYDEKHVFSRTRPLVPERFKGGYKVGARGVHPREFINEHYLPCLFGCRNYVAQKVERLEPVFRTSTGGTSVFFEGFIEMGNLESGGLFEESRVEKCKLPVESLADKIGFADPAAAVNCDKLGFVRIVESHQLVYLFGSANHDLLPDCSIRTVDILANTGDKVNGDARFARNSTISCLGMKIKSDFVQFGRAVAA